MAERVALGPHLATNRRRLVTPEGVDLSLGLATGTQRVGAFLLDLMIMLLLLIALTALAVWIGSSAAGGGTTQAILTAIWLLGFFVIRNGYFIMMESGRRAATLGKQATGTRVVARNGERLTVESVIARNLTREIEVYLPLSYTLYSLFTGGMGDPLLGWLAAGWLLLFLLFPLFNKDRLRIGDLLAGTWVVSIPRRRLAFDLSAQMAPRAGALQFTPEQLDAYGVYELQTLERVLREGQQETIHAVATTIRDKIDHRDPAPTTTSSPLTTQRRAPAWSAASCSESAAPTSSIDKA
jgi:uncharacterized RDD family membrane protein YckC